MAMSRTNYVEIAAILAGDYASANAEGKIKVQGIMYSLADYFLRDNPRFNRQTFYSAVLNPK